MQAADRFVTSLLTAGDEEKRREARRRRRIDFIAAGNRERSRLSKERLSGALQRGVKSMPIVEHNFWDSLGGVGEWWDLISDHALEEQRECEEAVRLQKELNCMFFTTTMKREMTEQSSVVLKDKRRMQELEEWCNAEERRLGNEAAEEAMRRVVAAVDGCIGFLEEHALEGSYQKSVLTQITLNAFVQRINNTPLTEEDRTNIAFTQIFDCHPFRLSSEPFLQLLHCMYQKMSPGPSTVTCFDISRKPLFLIDGPKLSGKSVVSSRVAAKLLMLHLSDRDLVTRALEAYRAERDGLPTFLTTECSDALPVISAYEERDEENNEVAYHSDARVEQVVESFVRLSPLAAIGKVIEMALFRGEPVDPSLVVRLMQLKIEDDTREECNGILFDGTVTKVEELRVLQSVIPRSAHLFEGALRGWPPSAEKPSLSSGLLLVPREPPSERVVSKAEGKPRPPKKGVDLSTLPPPVLPDVTREELSEEETNAIQRWEQQERVYPLFSAVVHIYCGANEIFNRFAGLRMDKETGEQYHMTFYPPPPGRAPHIVSLDRTRTSTAQLHRVLLSQQKDWAAMRRWLRCEEGGNQNVYEVNGEQSLEDMMTDVERILQDAQKEFEEGLRLYDTAMAAKKRQASIAANIAEQEERREAERKRLIAVYSEYGAPIPPELDPPVSLEPFHTMPDSCPEFFMQTFLIFKKRYEDIYRCFGATLELLANVLLSYRSTAMRVFYRFWNQPDEKQEKLDKYLANYNGLSVALLGHVACKDELHLLVDQLKEELFRIVEATGKEAIAKIDHITRKDFFLGPWSFLMCNIGIAMAQGEVERFLATLNLTAMYFGAVVNEPCAFEELESEVIALRSNAENALEQTKGKDKKTQGSKKTPRPDEIIERSAEEMFLETIGKLIAAMTSYVEKVSGVIATLTKLRESGKTSAALTDDGRQQLQVLSKCLPFAESELAQAQERIMCIRQLFSRMLHEGESYCARVRDDLLACTRTKQFNQASAVNTAIYFVRSAIEEEKQLGVMHLGRETFYAAPAAELQECADRSDLSLRHSRTPTPSGDPNIHSTLTASRLMEIISAFRSVAPDYALSRTEFFYIVRPADYAGAGVSNAGCLKTQEEVFVAFDSLGCGLMDWREFVVHLLLCCAPAPEVVSSSPSSTAAESFYIPDCTLEDLLETRSNLGLEKITKDVFCGVSFFFNKHLTDSRLGAYLDALWMTFEAEGGLLDPLTLLVFLCADRQPARGVQKVFYAASRSGDGLLTPEEMDLIFHLHVTNPRNMCQPDVFSPENIALLYNGASSLTFWSACERVMGRNMFNNIRTFYRKSFITSASHVK